MRGRRRTRSTSTPVRIAITENTPEPRVASTQAMILDDGLTILVTRLADRTAALPKQASTSTEQPATSPSVSTKTLRPSSPKGKSATVQDTSSPSHLAQIRAELASTQKTRSDLEVQVSTLTSDLSTLRATDTEQKKRIAQLEKIKDGLERRVKDRTEENKGKGKFVQDVQDEMVALNLQLNLAEQEKEKLKKDNEELTRRWMDKMEQEARVMNDKMGWEDREKRRK